MKKTVSNFFNEFSAIIIVLLGLLSLIPFIFIMDNICKIFEISKDSNPYNIISSILIVIWATIIFTIVQKYVSKNNTEAYKNFLKVDIDYKDFLKYKYDKDYSKFEMKKNYEEYEEFLKFKKTLE